MEEEIKQAIMLLQIVLKKIELQTKLEKPNTETTDGDPDDKPDNPKP